MVSQSIAQLERRNQAERDMSSPLFHLVTGRSMFQNARCQQVVRTLTGRIACRSKRPRARSQSHSAEPNVSSVWGAGPPGAGAGLQLALGSGPHLRARRPPGSAAGVLGGVVAGSRRFSCGQVRQLWVPWGLQLPEGRAGSRPRVSCSHGVPVSLGEPTGPRGSGALLIGAWSSTGEGC